MKQTKGTAWGIALVVAWLGACGGIASGPRAGGESHFLRHCSEGCGSLDCVSDICTRSCLVDQPGCGDLSAQASCTNTSVEPGAVAVCDLACEGDRDCSVLGVGFACASGFCRSVSVPSVGAGGAGDAAGVGPLILGLAGATPVEGSGGDAATTASCDMATSTFRPLGTAAASCSERSEVSCAPADPQSPEDTFHSQLRSVVFECVGAWEGALALSFEGGCATGFSAGPFTSANVTEQAALDCVAQALDTRRFACADAVTCVTLTSIFGAK